MSLPHLQAARADVERYARERRTIEPVPGLNDFRSILHAHGSDSTHTGGTREEMLADAKRAGVNVIMLTDHFRPPRDFIAESWRGIREGVLFIPGSEIRGFLIYPTRSIMEQMQQPLPEFIRTVREDHGLIFLSHIEERPDHSTDQLDGLEIYNRHADAKKDFATLLALVTKMTDPKQAADLAEALRLFPEEMLASQVDYPADYLAKWDADTQQRRLTGVAANDCHHNQILMVKMVDEQTVRVGTNVDPDEKMQVIKATLRPAIPEMTKGHKPGDVLVRLDFDPYHRSFRNVSTHILATELSEASVRRALVQGHAYVSHDWMCDATGFRFEAFAPSSNGSSAKGAARIGMMGDDLKWTEGLELRAELPVSCHVRLLNSGKVVAEHAGDSFRFAVQGPGVYRFEAWLTVDRENRGWIYTNPIYVR